jgi:hypothetical protein
VKKPEVKTAFTAMATSLWQGKMMLGRANADPGERLQLMRSKNSGLMYTGVG